MKNKSLDTIFALKYIFRFFFGKKIVCSNYTLVKTKKPLYLFASNKIIRFLFWPRCLGGGAVARGVSKPFQSGLVAPVGSVPLVKGVTGYREMTRRATQRHRARQ